MLWGIIWRVFLPVLCFRMKLKSRRKKEPTTIIADLGYSSHLTNSKGKNVKDLGMDSSLTRD